MPSSLARVISHALVSSTHLPVSVCGTGTVYTTPEGFLVSVKSCKFALCGLPVTPRALRGADLPAPHPQSLDPVFRHGACTVLLRHPWDHRIHSGTGILTCCPSATPLGLALGPTNPGRICLPQETLGLRRTDFSSVFSLLMPTYSPLPPPASLTTHLHRLAECSPTPKQFKPFQP